ncbi:MAG TPA: cellulase family glycosylhydrolase [Candidatus Acidoferrum sp.]|nr:cellulase family glycosylhydrolase [Candidatus Acidoferrum sp.]
MQTAVQNPRMFPTTPWRQRPHITRYRRVIVSCAHAVFLLGWLVPQPSGAAAVESFLHAQGQSIVNDKGDPIHLRGVGLGNWLLPEGYMWRFGNEADRPRRIEKLVEDLLGAEEAQRFWRQFRANYVTEADLERIAALGFNSVRPAINSRLLLAQAEPPVYSEEGFALLDHLIAWSKARGIYVILDMHAAPGGQTGQNIDDSADDQPELFKQPKYQDQLVALWATIARRYKDEPAVGGYDLLNEPLPARTGAADAFKANLEPLYKRITQAIRSVDHKHIIILEGADWANDWSVFGPPFDSNLVYQFHYYCRGNPVTLRSIQNYLDHRTRLNAPVWVGETGERDNAIYWATTEYFEANNIGWAFWPWKKMDTSNTPYSIMSPRQWQAVADYSRGGPKPSDEVAREAFAELLANIRLTNCTFFPDVVNAMLRQAPARIEAENFGREGLNKSYFVRDTNRLASVYRTSEPVMITALGTNRWQRGQYITLGPTEWTAYTVQSLAPERYQLTVRAKAVDKPAKARITIGRQVRKVNIRSNNWTEINLGTITLARGQNRLVWRVQSGAADLDWLDVTTAHVDQQPARQFSSAR